MALNKLDKTSEDHKMLETYPDEWAQVLMDLINKVVKLDLSIASKKDGGLAPDVSPLPLPPAGALIASVPSPPLLLLPGGLLISILAV